MKFCILTAIEILPTMSKKTNTYILNSEKILGKK